MTTRRPEWELANKSTEWELAVGGDRGGIVDGLAIYKRDLVDFGGGSGIWGESGGIGWEIEWYRGCMGV